MLGMRDAFIQQIDSYSNDLAVMAEFAGTMMANASKGLLDSDLAAAEDCITAVEELERLKAQCESKGFSLLALEGPVARDLRQIIAGINIIEDVERMGKLAVHIAKTARRRHPESALPEAIRPYFAEMAHIALQITAASVETLKSHDPEAATQLNTTDDAMDDLHQHLMTMLTKREWEYGITAAVDATLLTRYFERYSDHAVRIGNAIVFLATSKQLKDYLENKEFDFYLMDSEEKFREIEARFND